MITVAQAAAVGSVLAEEVDPEARATLIDNALPIAGLFVLILLGVMYLLWRSMSKQMKKIDPSLPNGPDDREQARDRAVTKEAVERGESAAPDDVAR
jgi:hypothetical protein